MKYRSKAIKNDCRLSRQPFLYVMIYIQIILYIKEVCVMKKDETLIEKVKQLSPEDQTAIVFLIKNFDLVKKCAKIRG